MALQAPGLRDAHLRFKLRGALAHPGVRRIGLLYLPVMASLALDVLVNRPFSYNLASRTGEGSISYMSWATTLIQFPQGLVAIAISVAILPTLSRQAANLSDAGFTAFKATLGHGLRLAIVLIIPAAVGLFILAQPVVSLIFEHGKFGPADTAVTALALRLYLLGLPFAAVDLLLVFAFYARQNTLTPALIGLVSLVAYMVVADLPAALVQFFRPDDRRSSQIRDPYHDLGVAAGARDGRVRSSAADLDHHAHGAGGSRHGRDYPGHDDVPRTQFST